MWSKFSRIKLIYAYVISPIWIFLRIGGNISAEIHHMYGSPAASATFVYSIRAAFILCMIGYFPLILSPTLVRFAVVRRKLKYGLEISIFLSLSLFMSLLVCYFLTGNIPLTFGLFDTLAVYCILSYKSSEYSEEWHSYKIHPILFMIIALILMVLVSGVITEQKQWHVPIWEAIFACCVLTRHKNKPIKEEPSPLASPPYPAANRTSQSMAELTAIGLASIGRKTHSLNRYLTVESTEERRRVERPFLRVIADKYRDEGQRKLLTRHFMLYKETTLFIIYASVLRADKQLHMQVQTELKKQLSLGLSAEVQKKRNDYWNRILRKFYDRYQQTGQTNDALNYSFWSVLSEEKPEYFPMESAAEFLGNNFLYDIFRYSYEGVEREYRTRNE